MHTLTPELRTSEPSTVATRSRWKTLARELQRSRTFAIGALLTLVFVLMATLGPSILTHDPYRQDILAKLLSPSSEHWLGTDELGRDVFSRIVLGARYSLIMSVSGTLIGALIGTAIGFTAGYFGRILDQAMMRVMDVLLALPGILLAIAIIAALGTSIVNVVIAIAVNFIPVFARLARSRALSIVQEDYVLAARAIGASDTRIIIRYLTPNGISPIIIQFSLNAGAAILLAAGLSFLGLGVQPPTPEWGSMLNAARAHMRVAPHVVMVPGLAIFFAVMGLNLLGDGLRDIFDPRHK